MANAGLSQVETIYPGLPNLAMLRRVHQISFLVSVGVHQGKQLRIAHFNKNRTNFCYYGDYYAF